MAENINININAKDNASTTISKVKTNLAGLSTVATTTQKNVIGLGSAFNGLKTVVAGLAIGSVTAGAFRLADGMVDVANATNLSTQSILGFSQAVALNGGDLQSAQNSLVKFTQTLGDARDGVASAQKTFADIGVSIEDLRNLSEQDILRQTVRGLGNINDAAKRSAQSVDIFGRSFARVDIQTVNEQLDGFIRRSGISAQAVANAGEVQGRFNDSIALFQIQLLEALDPLSELVLEISKNTEAMSKFFDTIIKIGTAIASLYGLSLVGKAISAIGTATRTAATGTTAVSEAFRLLKKGAEELGKVLDRLLRGTLGSRGGAIFGQIAKQIGFMTIQFGRLIVPLAIAAKLGYEFGQVLNGWTREEGRLQRIVDRVEGVRTEIEQLTTVAQANQAVEDATKQIEELTAQYEALRAEQGLVGKTWDEISSRFGAIPELTGMEEELDRLYDLRNVARLRARDIEEQNDLGQESVETAQDLLAVEQERQRIADEAARNMQNTIDTIAGLKEELMLLGLTERQQAIYNATKQAGTNATLEELAQISALAGELFDLTQIREQDAEATQQQAEAQAQLNAAVNNLAESYQEAISASQEFLANKRAEFDFQNQINTTYGVQRDVLEQLAEFDRDRIGNLERLKVAAEEAAAAGVEGAMDQYNAAVEAYQIQREQFEILAEQQAQIQNSFKQGWQEALANIADQFTPYQMAQDAILGTWNKIGSAIDQVAQGGKASFKDLARSVIADLGAMIAKAMVFNALKATFAAFGFSIPGLASGGPATAGKPYIVGEQGPELFVPKTSGTVVPNNQLGGSQQPTQVTNNVYNISAVDAKSVAQLFYENRRAMLGTINVAQKELPYGAMG